MLKLKKLRDLTLAGTTPLRPNYVYSASGLVELNNEFFIVADDELHMAIFPSDFSKPGHWLRLLPGELPEKYKDRKREKADLEAITHLPPHSFAPSGALLVVPSMSRPNRTGGALLLLKENGIAEPIPIDFSNIRSELSKTIKELNIEGVVLTENTVKLFHRGSGGNSRSAIIDIEIVQFLRDLHDTHVLSAKPIQCVREYDLGKIKDVDLAFTDASELPDGRIVFLSSAENSKNAYDDGAALGSAVGILNGNGDVVEIEQIEGTLKLEGISAKNASERLDLYFVADSDDQQVPAALFVSTWNI
jgi:hypothetical protein